jgi:2-methylcitrate dehydratase
MSSISEELTAFVRDLEFDDISRDAVHKMKQVLLDTVGCTLGGFRSTSADVMRKLSLELEGPAEAKIFGARSKTSCSNAILSNGVALRYLDYMDYLSVPAGNSLQPIHPSETIPTALALAEKQQLSGKELIVAAYLGCDLSGKFCSTVGKMSLAARGWHHATFGYYIMPLVAGKLLGLTQEQMCAALGASGCHATLGIVDAEGEEYNMMKNLAFPEAAFTGFLSAMMAKKGFTSPRRILEGEKSFSSSLLHGEGNLKRLLGDQDVPWIMLDRLKPYPACGAALGIVDAAVDIANEMGPVSDEISKVSVRAGRRTVDHVGDPAKRFPRNKETADHSAPFLIALALSEGRVEPDQFTNEKYSDRKILKLIDTVELEYSTELDKPELYPAAKVEVKKVDGSRCQRTSIYHKGHPMNPMSNEEVEKKFLTMAIGLLSEDEAKEVCKMILSLDRIGDISELAELM